MRKIKNFIVALPSLFFFGLISNFLKEKSYGSAVLVFITAIGVYYALWRIKESFVRKRNARRTAHTPIENPFYYKSFKLAGVSFDNDDGSSRQQYLRKLRFKAAPFDDFVDITIEPYDFQGEPAFAVCANGFQIGNVPRTHIRYFENDAYYAVEDFEVYGGGTTDTGEKRSYGCALTVRFYD